MAMNDESKPTEVKTLNLDALLRDGVERFTFETDAGQVIQGRELTWAMAQTLAERMPEPDSLSDLAAARVFMGSTAGVADPAKPDDLISESLPPQFVQQLTDNDIFRFAGQYLSEVAKQPELGDPILEFAKIARDEAKSSAEMIRKSSAAIRELFDKNHGYAAILKNMGGLGGSKFRLGSQMEELMRIVSGPSKSIADSVGGAMEQLRKSGLDTGLYSPSTLRATDTHRLIDGLRPPPLEDTAHGRTMMAAEQLVEAAERFEGLMENVVSQVGATADLVGGVTQAIKEEARDFESRTAAQTKSAISYAKWSFIVSAIALVVSAGAAIWDQLGSATDSAEVAARAASQLSELTQINQRLDEQVTLQRQSIEVAMQDARRRAEMAAAQAARIEELEKHGLQGIKDAPPVTR